MNPTHRFDRAYHQQRAADGPAWAEALAGSIALRWLLALLYIWLNLFVFSTLVSWSGPGAGDTPEPHAAATSLATPTPR